MSQPTQVNPVSEDTLKEAINGIAARIKQDGMLHIIADTQREIDEAKAYSLWCKAQEAMLDQLREELFERSRTLSNEKHRADLAANQSRNYMNVVKQRAGA